MTIAAIEVGTPQQPFVPLNQIAIVGAGAVIVPEQAVSSRACKLPSAAGIPSYFAFWAMVNSLNPGVWNFWSLNPSDIATAQALTNAAEQEWTGNPASGHNLAVA